MNKKIFNYYSKLATQNLSLTEISGRYSFQKKNEISIASDILRKINISKKDELLEIGSGPGNIAIRLFKYCKSYTAIDNKNSIKLLKNKNINIKTIIADFFKFKSKKKYDKIIIYSVLHCLTNIEDVYKFLNKAIKLTKPNGIIFIGDIPNNDKKKRFLQTKSGKQFELNWNKIKKNTGTLLKFKTINFNDKKIIKIITYLRKKGHESYILEQDETLPFSRSREDIIIKINE